MTDAEFKEACKAVCQGCAAGSEPHVRNDTGEMVHSFARHGRFTHMMCAAADLISKREAELNG